MPWSGARVAVDQNSPFCDAEGNAGRGDQYLQFLFDDYLDMGTAEGDDHLTHVQQLHQQWLRKGYRPGETCSTWRRITPGHDEDAWGRRLRTALYFLLPCPPATASSDMSTGS